MNFFSQKNRILLKELIKTDFKLRYQGSFIGYLWSILKPLMMFTIMYLVFVRFLRFDDGTPHYAVGLLLAMIFWGFFTEATNMGMLSIVSRGDLLRKLKFPKQTIVSYSQMHGHEKPPVSWTLVLMSKKREAVHRLSGVFRTVIFRRSYSVASTTCAKAQPHVHVAGPLDITVQAH